MGSSAEIRRLSRALLGNGVLLEVATAIGRLGDGVFTASDIRRATGILDLPVIKTALVKLEAANLVKRLPQAGTSHPLERQASCYWSWAAEFLSELGGQLHPLDQ